MAIAASSRSPGPATAKVLSNLAALSLVLVAGGLALAYGIDSLSERATVPASLEDQGQAIVQNLGGRVLTIPVSWLRYGVGNGEGFASQIDLSLPVLFAPGGTPSMVTVTLLPRSRARSSASLLDGVYLHQFGDEADTSIPGIIGKPLQGTDGFAGETVWYDPLSADPFAAKCLAPVANRGEAQCLRTVILSSGIAATFEFGAGLLPHWAQFDAALAPWLGRIGAL
jgi:hypothetical protein